MRSDKPSIRPPGYASSRGSHANGGRLAAATVCVELFQTQAGSVGALEAYVGARRTGVRFGAEVQAALLNRQQPAVFDFGRKDHL